MPTNDEKRGVPHSGPRGGKTTISKTGMVRKAVNLNLEEWNKLRKLAYEEDRPASEIVREALQVYFETRKGKERKPGI